MAAISQTAFFVNGQFCVLIQIPLKFVPMVPIDNKSAVVRVMLGAEYTVSHYLNLCWPISLMHICGTSGGGGGGQ